MEHPAEIIATMPDPPTLSVTHTKRGAKLARERRILALVLDLRESIAAYGGDDCGVINGASRGELAAHVAEIWDELTA